MAKVKVDFKKLRKNFEQKIDRIQKVNQFKDKMGQAIVKDIKINARKGKDFEGNPFPGLKNSTIDNREYLEKYNPTHPDYAPEKSNLTFTGKLIDSITYSKVVGRLRIIVFGKGKHPGYQYKNKKGKSVPNEEILGHLAKRGWKVLGLSEKVKKQIAQQYKRLLRRNLR